MVSSVSFLAPARPKLLLVLLLAALVFLSARSMVGGTVSALASESASELVSSAAREQRDEFGKRPHIHHRNRNHNNRHPNPLLEGSGAETCMC